MLPPDFLPERGTKWRNKKTGRLAHVINYAAHFSIVEYRYISAVPGRGHTRMRPRTSTQPMRASRFAELFERA